MDELLTYLKERDAAREREEWLRRRGYADPRHADFLLNPRTRRLSPRAEQRRDLADRFPLAVFLALPDSPFTEIVDPARDEFWAWLNDHTSRRYEPVPKQPFLRGSTKPMLDGVLIADGHSAEGKDLRSFVS